MADKLPHLALGEEAALGEIRERVEHLDDDELLGVCAHLRARSRVSSSRGDKARRGASEGRTGEAERDERQDVLLEAPCTDAARDVDRTLVPGRPEEPVARVEVRDEVGEDGVVGA